MNQSIEKVSNEEIKVLKARLEESLRLARELQEKLEDYSDFMENSAVALHWVDRNGTIIWANQAELDLLGYTRDEYIGSPVSKYHSDSNAIGEILQKLSSFQTIHNYPTQLVCRDGSLKKVLISSNVLVREGEFIHTRCLTRDITEWKSEEDRKSHLLLNHIETLKKVEDNEERLRMATEATGLGTWDYYPLTGQLNWSKRCREIYGIADDAPITLEVFSNQIFPDDKLFAESEISKAMDPAGEGSYDVRFRIIPFDNNSEPKWIRSQGKVFFNNERQAERFIGTVIDITEDKKRELAKDHFSEELSKQVKERTEELKFLNEQLRIQNETFRHAEESSVQGSYSFDLTTGELKYSDNLFRLIGFEPGDFTPSIEEFNKHVHPEDQDYVSEAGQKVVATQLASEWKYRMIHKSGDIINIKGTGRIIKFDNHAILVGTLQNVTKDTLLHDSLMAKEKILALKNEELERQNTELASFSYVASHDLQEPLRKIRIFASRILAREHKTFSEDGQYYFSRITSAAERMQNLIEALLSYSRASTSERDFKNTNLNTILTEVKSILQDPIDEKNILVNADKLPTLKVIPLQFQQLFLNIISNGIKYSREDVRSFIKVSAELVPSENIDHNDKLPNINYWNITIEDNGIGFDQQYAEKIFDLFQRLHGKQEYEGTGIGLSICKKIMQNHNGFIKAHGTPGAGAKFSLFLPENSQD